MARPRSIREAIELLAAMASLAPALALAGCDVDEHVTPVPTVDPEACRPTPFTPMPADTCGAYVHMPCGLPSGVKPISGPGCYFSIPDCKRICGDPAFFSCHTTEANCDASEQVVPGMDGSVEVDCVTCIGNAGRAFDGLNAPSTNDGGADPIGAALARMAWLEAASVRAFRRLEADLARLGAPRELRARAARARADEARHARIVGAAAARRGARVPRVSSRRRRSMSREAIAVENAVEGCVGETLAALVLAWDRARAEPGDVRAVFEAVADDEARHAVLALDVHAFLVEGLEVEARERVAEATSSAVARALASPALGRLPRDARGVAEDALRGIARATFPAFQRTRRRP